MASREVPHRFDVAFSFAGEQRKLIGPVAKELEKRLGKSSVFYDAWYEHLLAGTDADIKLQDIYTNRCDLVVVCISANYGNKPWTQAEHSAIRSRQMLAQSDKAKMAILPLRVGDGDVPGITFNTIAPDIRNRKPLNVVQLIRDRLKLAQ